jgi:hypothetical protein
MPKKTNKKTVEAKQATTPTPVVAPPVVAPIVPKLTTGDHIWNEIKDKNINMFALPGKKVSDYCKPVPLEPNRCFLVANAQAFISALEESIGSNYVCERMEKYVVVSRKVF